MSVDGWQTVTLGGISRYSRERISREELDVENYVSTENMLPDKGGKTVASSLPKGNAVRFKAGQTLISNIRPYFKKIWFATLDGGASADVLVFMSSKEVEDRYFYYLLNQDHFFDYMVAGSKGTKMPRGDKQQIMMYPLGLPPFKEQKAIAATLSCLDDKIELNNQINRTLEDMAQAIFKSWFVDFEPFQDGEFEDSELGMIPKGWRVGALESVSKDIICGKTPSTKVKTNYGDFMPFVTIPDMHGKIYVIKTERYLSKQGVNTQPNKVLPKHSIVVSCIATPGLVVLTSEESQTNQQINSIICKNNISSFYIFLNMRNLSDKIKDLGSGGSTTLNLNKTNFSKIKILIPNEKVMCDFHKRVEVIFDLLLENQHLNHKLITIRNTLLPKLMSGEVRVPIEEVQ
jgi:type I restriction enzyme, S subunit